MNSPITSKLDIVALLNADRKGARRQLQIAEQAIEIIHQNGIADFSFELLAKKSKVTRSLIYRYFPNHDALITFLSQLIRHRYQEFVLNSMADKTQFPELFSSYLHSALMWVDKFPKDARVWLIYFHLCSIDSTMGDQNRRLVEQGTHRIVAMLQMGAKSKKVGIRPSDFVATARTIQMLITGFLISRATELRSQEEWHELKEFVVKKIWKTIK